VSIRRDPRSPFWQYNFQIRNHRFFGSTKKTTRREAEKVEAVERERAREFIAQAEAARTSLRLDDVAGRYWSEHAQHLAGAPNTWTLLGIVLEFFGKDKLVTEITDDDVARLVAWRRGLRKSGPRATQISPHTVNHTVTTLRRLFTRCKLWGVRFAHEPKWTKHLLKVPVERARELSEQEADSFAAVVRADYAPFFAFARASGLRLTECLRLRWSEVEGLDQTYNVNLKSRGRIVKLGKGGKRVTVPITSEIRDILLPLRGHDPEFVFTYVCEHPDARGRVKGQRYPLTRGGLQSYWQQLRKQWGIGNFRIHDFRHDFATKLLRHTGNLRLVQRALNHASIKTTTRYAHVLDTEVAEAMEATAELRKKLRIKLKVV
jgi:integrase